MQNLKPEDGWIGGSQPEVHSLLVVSTAHVTLEEARMLDACGYSWSDAGWFFYVVEVGDAVLPEIDSPSEGLAAVIVRARELKCLYVLLDRDAEALEGVTTYDW